MTKANNGRPVIKEKKKAVKTTVFNSGLWTIAPHCITSPFINFPGVGRPIFVRQIGFQGWLCWKLLSTDKMNHEHLSIDSSDKTTDVVQFLKYGYG